MRSRVLHLAALVLACTIPPAALAQQSRNIYKEILPGSAFIITKDGTGSGWLVDAKDRLMITNHHVVQDEPRVTVMFPIYKDGQLVAERKGYKEERGYRAKVIDTDVPLDLAVIQLIDPLPDGVKALPLADQSAGPGDAVHGVGNPGASDALWIYNSGTVRQVYRKDWRHVDGRLRQVFERHARVLETQSPINPGDSGSAVINDQGQVVAVNSSSTIRDQGNKEVRLMSIGIDLEEVKKFLAQSRRLMAPATAQDHLLVGQRYYLRGLYTEAIDALTEAIRRDGELSEAYRRRAQAFSRKRDYDTALAEYDVAIRRNPNDHEAYLGRAHCHKLKNNDQQAIADYTKAIQIKPDYAAAYNDRGVIYHNSGKLAEALQDYSRALEADPRHAIALMNRGTIHYRHQRYEQATADSNQALRINPFLANAWNIRGLCAQVGKDYNRAIDDLAEAVTLQPKNALYHVNLGNCLADKSDWNRALALYNKAVELDRGYARAYYHRARAYELLGNDAKAQPDYAKAIDLDADYGKEITRQYKRYLRVANERTEPVKVFVQYETRTTSGKWVWYPEAPGNARAKTWVIQPGQSVYLLDEDWRVRGRRIRIWGEGVNTGRVSTTHRDQDVWIAPVDGYLASKETVFTYTFQQ